MKTDIQQLRRTREQEIQARELLADLARRRRELMLRLSESGMTYEKIGLIYDVGKERVRQNIEIAKRSRETATKGES